MKQALEALNEVTGWTWTGPMRVMDEVEDAITALRTAIEEAEKQEPPVLIPASLADKQFERYYRQGYDAGLAAPVQEPVAWVDLLKQAEKVVRSKPLWKKYIDGTPLANDIAVWMATFAQEHTTHGLTTSPTQGETN